MSMPFILTLGEVNDWFKVLCYIYLTTLSDKQNLLFPLENPNSTQAFRCYTKCSCLHRTDRVLACQFPSLEERSDFWVRTGVVRCHGRMLLDTRFSILDNIIHRLEGLTPTASILRICESLYLGDHFLLLMIGVAGSIALLMNRIGLLVFPPNGPDFLY